MNNAEAATDQGPDLPDRGGRFDPTYRYGLVLLLLLVSFFFVGISPDGPFGPLITIVIEAVTLLVTLSATGAHRRLTIAAWVLCFVAVVVGIAHAINQGSADLPYTSVLSAVLVTVAPIAIVRSVIRRRVLDIQTVLAALALYVMIGMIFSFIFSVVQAISGDPFFSQAPGDPSRFLYFSFVTMTTVGYGDFTAAAGLGRTLAAFEAMLGQMYLVTVVALLVSNLGPVANYRRKTAKDRAEAGDVPATT
jgi:hypothetical protein